MSLSEYLSPAASSSLPTVIYRLLGTSRAAPLESDPHVQMYLHAEVSRQQAGILRRLVVCACLGQAHTLRVSLSESSHLALVSGLIPGSAVAVLTRKVNRKLPGARVVISPVINSSKQGQTS